MWRIQWPHLVGFDMDDGRHGINAEKLRFVRHVISLSLEFYIQTNVYVEITLVVFPVGYAPEGIHPD